MEPERLIEAKWDDIINQSFMATLKLHCENRGGLLAEITTVISNMKIPISAAFARADLEKGTADIQVTFEVKSTSEIDEVTRKLSSLAAVIDVHR
jgi:Guanosine polyphosphate pyrophosphohydrolases/synthetases